MKITKTTEKPAFSLHNCVNVLVFALDAIFLAFIFFTLMGVMGTITFWEDRRAWGGVWFFLTFVCLFVDVAAWLTRNSLRKLRDGC